MPHLGRFPPNRSHMHGLPLTISVGLMRCVDTYSGVCESVWEDVWELSVVVVSYGKTSQPAVW